MEIVNITSESDLEKLVKSRSLVVIHFYADWAEQCKAMNDVIEELAKQPELKDVKFAKCLAEELAKISIKYEVSFVPTCIILNQTGVIDRVDGANAAELTEKINKQLQLSNPIKLPTKEDLNTRLKKLISLSPAMLFMKGNPLEPKCGFSRTIIGILEKHKAKYKTFDILTDEEVRQGLKEFSNWPTYPQLYINGELIGGLDIVKEMDESGELNAMLPKKIDEKRLTDLTNKSHCMVFMKGNRNEPKCGFSRQLIEILSGTGVEYETFDILEDEDVRQGLKEFSDWPTYPQVYIKGELIGGLDILKELKSSGELELTLRG